MNAPPIGSRITLSPAQLAYIGGFLLLFVFAVVAAFVIVRKLMHGKQTARTEDWTRDTPDVENPSALMTASMQGVIEKLRTQEKELARLHLLANERAQESERLTEELTRNMPTGLLIVSTTGTISAGNPAAAGALGAQLLRYRSYKEILGAESQLAWMITACLRDGQTFQREEVEHTTRDGEVRRLGVTISPIYQATRGLMRTSAGTPSEQNLTASEAKVTGALCLMSDLTELAALQKQVRWKENLAALGEMSAGIAHEFKNALATISGYAQMIRSEAPSGEIHESAERIVDQTRSLTHVVTEFLRFAKPLEISYESVPMTPLVERVASDLHDAFPQCEVSCDGRFEEVPGDEALLQQALLNLTRNGIEAAQGAGVAPKIVISGSVEDLGGRKWQRICIADNGPGIPQQDLPKIFLPFYTTKSEGTGLGLAVVQKVTLQHGGSIEARNRSGAGAEFLLWLPLRQEVSPSLFPSAAARI
ncbi:MAG TPA: ATP-binding protein [Candidatus Acidoferrales bacterium]|nr:ATP-binding protein [Candidatus Acidoferrales bacterium]